MDQINKSRAQSDLELLTRASQPCFRHVLRPYKRVSYTGFRCYYTKMFLYIKKYLSGCNSGLKTCAGPVVSNFINVVQILQWIPIGHLRSYMYMLTYQSFLQKVCLFIYRSIVAKHVTNPFNISFSLNIHIHLNLYSLVLLLTTIYSLFTRTNSHK